MIHLTNNLFKTTVPNTSFIHIKLLLVTMELNLIHSIPGQPKLFNIFLFTCTKKVIEKSVCLKKYMRTLLFDLLTTNTL